MALWETPCLADGLTKKPDKEKWSTCFGDRVTNQVSEQCPPCCRSSTMFLRMLVFSHAIHPIFFTRLSARELVGDISGFLNTSLPEDVSQWPWVRNVVSVDVQGTNAYIRRIVYSTL